MRRALTILCVALFCSGCQQSGLKDEHIRHQLTDMVASLSQHGAGAIRESTSALNAIVNVESSKLSGKQHDLLFGAAVDLRSAGDGWSQYRLHYYDDNNPAEVKASADGMATFQSHIEKAKAAITEAAATF